MPGVIGRSTRGTRSKLASKLPSGDKQSPEKTATLTPRSTNIEVLLPSRKRKVDQDDSEPTAKKLRSESAAQSAAPTPPLARALWKVSFADPETPPAKPRPNRKATPVPSLLAATPSSCATPSTSRKRRCESDETSQAEALLERLNLESPSAYKRKKTTVHRREPPDDFDLPQELNDLLNLHVAFLRTLDMQYAHSGRTTPIDLRTLYPSVTRAWGKRHVGLVDIQRCVGVLSWSPVKSEASQPKAPYFLCDYGRDKICLEFHADAEPGPLRQHKLNMDFEANLRSLWLNSHGQPGTIFIGTLPKAPIKPSTSAAAAKSVQRSQTTLDSFKKSIAQKKAEEEQAAKSAPLLTPPHTPNGPKMSLLDRIRLKEQQAFSQANSAPTPAELQRRAALQRACDVAAVIGMLCKATAGGQARVSFTMAALMVKLKDSVRTPISQEDGECCVRLLASEVAPGWLRILKAGGRENVVVMVAAQPSKVAVEERVAALLG
ncbi:hypothetical protein C8A03DRAFT_12111 [Achaetomium macrosporum]|uniref:DNA replication factor Cdt1 C-terminal domain-containing protein n=1 Tax=Achaetomium macrosporum TaxID=79813 RepID=A0AAN7HE16_9PEZI|nr:hypothetical protein C8A03DRAFT_12111 [Achaetomium macrosporum]